MPYERNADLPERVKNHLPDHAQAIFRESFNHSLTEYHQDEERAFRVAWSAVGNKYEKDEKTGQWKAK